MLLLFTSKKYLTFCSLCAITRVYIDVLEKCATFLDHPVYLPPRIQVRNTRTAAR